MLTSERPYLIKAIYQWLTDNGVKVFVKVNIEYAPSHIPLDANTNNGYVILRIDHNACGFIDLTREDYIELQIRFGGVPHTVKLYYNAIDSIYCPDHPSGMNFMTMDPLPQENTRKEEKKNFLKLVK